MDAKKLEILMTAVDLGSFSKASEVVGYTQSGLTHLVDSLEERYAGLYAACYTLKRRYVKIIAHENAFKLRSVLYCFFYEVYTLNDIQSFTVAMLAFVKTRK